MNNKIDKRTLKTKHVLKQALSTMMLSQNINDITVKNLVIAADINRSTFYLHYNDIFDLLQEMEDDILEQIQKVIDSYPKLTKVETLNFLTDLILVFDTNSEQLRALTGYHGDAFFIQKIEEMIETKARNQINSIYCFNKSIAPEHVYSFVRSGCVGMLKTWITSDCKTPPEEMASFVYCVVHDIINRLTCEDN